MSILIILFHLSFAIPNQCTARPDKGVDESFAFAIRNYLSKGWERSFTATVENLKGEAHAALGDYGIAIWNKLACGDALCLFELDKVAQQKGNDKLNQLKEVALIRVFFD